MSDRIKWPNNKDFAFSVFDDTDFATVENVKEVYSLLKDYGLQTTKSVWTLDGDKNSINNGLDYSALSIKKLEKNLKFIPSHNIEESIEYLISETRNG